MSCDWVNNCLGVYGQIFFERRKQEKFVFFVLCHVAIWRGPGLSGSRPGSQQPEVVSGLEASGQGKEQASRKSSNSIIE